MSYRSHLSLEAAEYVIALRRRQQRKVLGLAELLAEHPFAPGDYQTFDSNGRIIEHVLSEGFLFSYWGDHSSREVRVIEILRV